MKIKKLWDNHKWNILITGVGVVGLFAFYELAKYASKDSDSIKIPAQTLKREVLKSPEKLAGLGIEEFDNYSGAVEILTDDKYNTMKISDLGKLGEALCECPGIDENSFVFAMINAAKNTSE